MAHLPKLPTYFVKGEERRAAYFTVNARELIADGFVEEGENEIKPSEPFKAPEIVVEVGLSAFDKDAEKIEVEASKAVDATFEFLTKAELIKYAANKGEKLKPSMSRANMVKICLDLFRNEAV